MTTTVSLQGKIAQAKSCVRLLKAVADEPGKLVADALLIELASMEVTADLLALDELNDRIKVQTARVCISEYADAVVAACS